MKNIITIRRSIFIDKPKEVVWDFTQDYTNRKNWDRTVIEAKVLQSFPNRLVKLRFRDNSILTFIYKQDDRPRKTSLSTTDVQSPLLLSAGGSWVYETKDSGTVWTQHNTIILKNHFFIKLISPLFKWIFTSQVKNSMQNAKRLIEQ